MKKVLMVLFSLTLFTGFIVTTASAAIYISGNLGAVFVNDADIKDDGDSAKFTFDTGGVATFAVGTTIGSAVRIEAEIGGRVSDYDKYKYSGRSWKLDGDVTTVSYMANAYYDFKNESRYTPFVGGGLGLANVEYDLDKIDGDKINEKDDDNVMAYQIILGGSFAATERLDIDLQYRYFATKDPDLFDADLEYQTHNVMLGLRYNF